jgi:hypothetical protein
VLPQVILIYGPGSGLGKSTLSRDLTKRLSDHGSTCRLFAEEEVLTHSAFQSYIGAIKAGRASDMEALLEACRQFVTDLSHWETQFVVVDSVLPAWDWLFSAGCSPAEVSSFSLTLAEMLAPIRTTLVYVRGDLDVALSRATADRGEEWVHGLATLRTGNRDIQELRSYFLRLQDGAESMLRSWPYRSVDVDTVVSDLPSCVDRAVSAIMAGTAE